MLVYRVTVTTLLRLGDLTYSGSRVPEQNIRRTLLSLALSLLDLLIAAFFLSHLAPSPLCLHIPDSPFYKNTKHDLFGASPLWDNLSLITPLSALYQESLKLEKMALSTVWFPNIYKIICIVLGWFCGRHSQEVVENLKVSNCWNIFEI